MNRSQIEDLKKQVDLLQIVEKDLGPGESSGAWKKFICPFHDDHNPSLAVTNGRNGMAPYWKCFAASCGRSGDVISWLTDYRGMTFRDSLDALGGNPNDNGYVPAPVKKRIPKPQPPPDRAWQRKARKVVEITHKKLMSPAGTKAWAWLKNRGLNESSIKAWELGYSSGEKIMGLWVPRGIVIPCFSYGRFWYLKVRRPTGKPKYKKVSGSRSGLFGADTTYHMETVFIVEGEFDAILLWQHVHDYAGVISPGSATDRVDPVRWGRLLLPVSHLLAAYDRDEAGKKGFENLQRLTKHIKRAELPEVRNGESEVKDITDFYLAGGDLNSWARYQLEMI